MDETRVFRDILPRIFGRGVVGTYILSRRWNPHMSVNVAPQHLGASDHFARADARTGERAGNTRRGDISRVPSRVSPSWTKISPRRLTSGQDSGPCTYRDGTRAGVDKRVINPGMDIVARTHAQSGRSPFEPFDALIDSRLSDLTRAHPRQSTQSLAELYLSLYISNSKHVRNNICSLDDYYIWIIIIRRNRTAFRWLNCFSAD